MYICMYLEHVIAIMRKAEWKKICLVPSAETEEICNSLFSLENSKFHTSIAKVCVLEVLQIIFSITIEIPTVKEKQSY